MPDGDTLQARITALATDDIKCDALGRRIVPLSSNATQALTNEVAQTQLQRRLAFHNQNDAILSLIVKAGRVIALSHETTPALVKGLIKLPDQSVVAVNSELTSALSKLVARFLDGCTNLSVVSHFADAVLPAYDVGLDLHQVMQSDTDATVAPTFADHLTRLAIASVVTDLSYERIETGDAAQCELITAAMANRSLPDADGDRCLILGCDTAAGCALVIARQNDLQVGAFVRHDAVSDVMAQWAAAMRGQSG